MVGGDANPTLQAEPTQDTAGPLRRALRVGCSGGLQSGALGKIHEGLAVKEDEMTGTMKSAPVVMAEEAAVQRVNIRSLDEDETARGQELVHGAEDGRGGGDVLNEV